jgi:hypothetical protein
VILALVEQNGLSGARSDLATAEGAFQPGGPCDPKGVVADPNGCNTRVNDAASRVSDLETGRTVGWVAAGVGGAVLATGVTLLLTGNDPHKYDERPTDRLFGRWHVTPHFAAGQYFVSVATGF